VTGPSRLKARRPWPKPVELTLRPELAQATPQWGWLLAFMHALARRIDTEVRVICQRGLMVACAGRECERQLCRPGWSLFYGQTKKEWRDGAGSMN
jgi:hypothetical protein